MEKTTQRVQGKFDSLLGHKNLQILYLKNLTSIYENVLAFPVQLVAPRHLTQ
jgi:hypothetical protein